MLPWRISGFKARKSLSFFIELSNWVPFWDTDSVEGLLELGTSFKLELIISSLSAWRWESFKWGKLSKLSYWVFLSVLVKEATFIISAKAMSLSSSLASFE